MNEKLMILTIALMTLGFCCAKENQQQLIGQNPCVLKQTCHECIQTPTCAWCGQPVRSIKHLKTFSLIFFLCNVTFLS